MSVSEQINIKMEVVGPNGELYLRVVNEGQGAPQFALDFIWEGLDSPPPEFPEGFEPRGTVKVNVNGQEHGRLRVYRFFWDADRAPLFPGVEEPLPGMPILLGPTKELAWQVLILRIASSDGATVRGFQFDGYYVLKPLGKTVEIVAGSEIPQYRVKG